MRVSGCAKRRSLWHGSHALAGIQHSLVAAFWPFFAGIVYQLVTAMAQFAPMILLLLNKAPHRLRGENLLHSFGLVKATVIHRELALSSLSVDFDEPFAEPDVAPAVILLCLDGSSYHRIDARH